MKFVCDRCQTRYSIADEKVRQRILRIRCKTCSNVITVEAGAVVSGPQDSPKRQEPAAGPPPAARPSSRLSLPPARPHEWFVAVDGVERGPLSCTTAAKYIVSLKPEQSVHVWKEGMDGWKRPKDVAIIAQEISAVRLSPARASSHMPAVPTDASSARSPVLSPADSASRPQVPASRPKPPPVGGSGSGPKLPQPRIPGSGPRVSPPISGSGPKAAPPPIPGSGPKAPPAGHSPGAKPGPAGGFGLGPAQHRVPDSAPLSLKKGPALPGLTPSAGPGLAQGVAALGTHVPGSARPTAPLEPASDDEFDQAQKTPLPGKPLLPIAAPARDGHAVADWLSSPLGPQPDLPQPARLSATRAAVAVLNPSAIPAPSAGSLFGNVAALSAGFLPEEHVHSDISTLANLAALARRHRYLKYVVAASVVVVLVVLVILFSWRGDSGRTATPTLQGAAHAPEAASSIEVETPPQNEPALGEAAVGSEVEPKGRTTARRTSKRSSLVRSAGRSGKVAPVGQDPFEGPPVRPAGRSGKVAPVGQDPFEGPSPSSHLSERPAPVQMPGQSRGPRAGSPGAAVREVSQVQIGAVVRNKENQAGIKTCYERALRRDGRLRTGRLDVTVSVGENGTVRHVQVQGPADFLLIDGCIKDAIRHWHFPANSEEYAASFPLILQGG